MWHWGHLVCQIKTLSAQNLCAMEFFDHEGKGHLRRYPCNAGSCTNVCHFGGRVSNLQSKGVLL